MASVLLGFAKINDRSLFFHSTGTLKLAWDKSELTRRSYTQGSPHFKFWSDSTSIRHALYNSPGSPELRSPLMMLG